MISTTVPSVVFRDSIKLFYIEEDLYIRLSITFVVRCCVKLCENVSITFRVTRIQGDRQKIQPSKRIGKKLDWVYLSLLMCKNV